MSNQAALVPNYNSRDAIWILDINIKDLIIILLYTGYIHNRQTQGHERSMKSFQFVLFKQ